MKHSIIDDLLNLLYIICIMLENKYYAQQVVFDEGDSKCFTLCLELLSKELDLLLLLILFNI